MISNLALEVLPASFLFLVVYKSQVPTVNDN